MPRKQKARHQTEKGKYVLVNDIRNKLNENLTSDKIYRDIHELLVDWGMIYAVASSVMGKQHLLPEFLRIIARATLNNNWKKPFELIGEAEFQLPKPGWCLAGIRCKRTIYLLKKKAVASQLICGFEAKSPDASYTQWHVALNIGEILLRGIPYAGAAFRNSNREHTTESRALELCVNIILRDDITKLLKIIYEKDEWLPAWAEKPSIKELRAALDSELEQSNATYEYIAGDKRYQINRRPAKPAS